MRSLDLNKLKEAREIFYTDDWARLNILERVCIRAGKKIWETMPHGRKITHFERSKEVRDRHILRTTGNGGSLLEKMKKAMQEGAA